LSFSLPFSSPCSCPSFPGWPTLTHTLQDRPSPNGPHYTPQAKLQGRDTPPVDLVGRERALAAFFDVKALPGDARVSRAVVSALTGQPEPEPRAQPSQQMREQAEKAEGVMEH